KAPPAALVGRNLLAPLPWRLHRRFAPRMAKLHPDRHPRFAPDAFEQGRDRRCVLVGPYPEIGGADAPFRLDRGRVGKHQPGAPEREVPAGDQMPARRKPVLGGVLTHRRDDDPVPEFEAPELDGLKQVAGHDTFPRWW